MTRNTVLPLGKLFLLIAVGSGTVFSQPSIRIVVDGNIQASLPLSEKEGVFYVDPAGLFNALGYTATHVAETQTYLFQRGVRQVKVMAGNPFVACGDSIYQLVFPPFQEKDGLQVPFYAFLELIGRIIPGRMQFDKTTLTLEIFPPRHSITGIQIEEKENGTIIRILTNRPFQPSDLSHFIQREWLNVHILGASLDSLEIAATPPAGIVKRVVPFSFSNSVQISFLLDRKVRETQAAVKPDEITVSLFTQKRGGKREEQNDPIKARWRIDRIVIDPGHGGRDPGAIGVTGLQEKEVNLDIAKRVKTLLEKNLNVEVLLTREADIFIPLEERTRFANVQRGKLFVSIHANHSPQKTAQGVSAYLLGMHKTEQALAVAEKENSVVKFEESQAAYRELQDAIHIMNAIAQSAYLEESEELARSITQKIAEKGGIPNQGVYQAGLYVLMGAAMPRVLIEIAYLSNPWEEKLLRRNDFRQRVAEAIYESIRDFKHRREAEIR